MILALLLIEGNAEFFMASESSRTGRLICSVKDAGFAGKRSLLAIEQAYGYSLVISWRAKNMICCCESVYTAGLPRRCPQRSGHLMPSAQPTFLTAAFSRSPTEKTSMRLFEAWRCFALQATGKRWGSDVTTPVFCDSREQEISCRCLGSSSASQ